MIFEEILLQTFISNIGVHSYLVVEVGHVPSILFIVVVVSIGAVVARGNALSIGGRGSVVEVHSVSTMGTLSSRSLRVLL